MTNMINNEGLKGLYLKLKVIYYRPQANLIPNIEKLKMLPLKLDKDDNTKEKESELERKKDICQCLQKIYYIEKIIKMPSKIYLK